MKKIVRLTESQLRQVIEKTILKEQDRSSKIISIERPTQDLDTENIILKEMRITKQVGKHNQFNIENLTLAMALSIINALDYCKSKGLITGAGVQLIDALNNQLHKLKLDK